MNRFTSGQKKNLHSYQLPDVVHRSVVTLTELLHAVKAEERTGKWEIVKPAEYKSQHLERERGGGVRE